MRGAFQTIIMASEKESRKSPLPPRAKSVPLLSKPMPIEPLSPTSKAKRKSSGDLNKTMPTRSVSMLNSSGPIFGTPSHPSPLDRIRTSKKNLFSSVELSQSMPDQRCLMNQSLPEIWREMKGISKEIKEEEGEEDIQDEQWTGNALHSFSFAPIPYRGSFCNIPEPGKLQASMSASWQFFNYVSAADAPTAEPIVIRNPNKAVITFNAKTSEILVANDVACDMFAYTHDELIGMKMSKMFTKNDEARQEALVEQHIEDSGAVVMVSGKVYEAVDSNNVIFPVSLWMKKVTWEKEPRCIAVLEPVERRTAQLVFDCQGSILECDQQLAYLHGYSSPDELVHMNVKQLIPSFVLPVPGQVIDKKIKKQQATGRTKDGPAFPLSISIKENNHQTSSYSGVVWVFSNISGLVSVLPNGSIYSCNENFTLMLFGYSDDELVGKSITQLVPAFYDHMDLVDDSSMPFPPMDEDDDLEISSRLSGVDNGRAFTPKETAVIYSREIDSQASNKSYENFQGDEKSNREYPYEVHSPVEEQLPRNYFKFTSHDLGNLSGTTGSIHPSEMDSTRATLGDSSPSTISLCSLMNADDGAEEPGNERNDNPNIECADNEEVLEDCFDTTPRASDYNRKEKELPDVNEEISENHGSNRGDQLSLNVIEQVDDNNGDDRTPEDNIEHNRTPVDERGNEGHSEDSVFSSSNRSRDGIAESNSPEDPVAVSSPLISARDQDSGVYTAEDLFRDMLEKRGKDVNDLRPCSSTETESTGTSGQRSTPIRPSGPRTDVLTSTPNMSSAGDTPSVQSPVQPICEGMFVGRARHKDGSSLSLLFQIKKVELKDGQVLFCVWITKDPEDEEGGHIQGNHTLGSSHNSLFVSSVGGIKELGQSISELSIKDEKSPGRGRYDERYVTLDSIGKGAFGFVKLAKRKSDNREVVVKFIRKDKVLKGSWRDDPVLGTVPFEISLLSKLKHPNIVKLIDAFENEDFFQLVMEKHGGGMDMFEFIDRQPNMDEALASYLFRQVVEAVAYLHSKNILHRDVKDENVILDEMFTVKMIDFGSAAMMEEGKLFSTFCGTMEYCSPEVLLGNKYRGPELEIWSMGVTLYTLIFGENPFYDVEETIRSELHPPFAVSQDLMFLICWMLHPDPQYRIIMQDLLRNPWLTQPVDIHMYSFTSVVGGVEGELQEILDEERDKMENHLDLAPVTDVDHEHKYLQAAYQQYIESVDNDDDDR